MSLQSMTAVHSDMSWFLGLMGNVANAVSSFGTMFLVRNASMDGLLNTSTHGSRIILADLSAGCQADKADDNLFLMVG